MEGYGYDLKGPLGCSAVRYLYIDTSKNVTKYRYVAPASSLHLHVCAAQLLISHLILTGLGP